MRTISGILSLVFFLGLGIHLQAQENNDEQAARTRGTITSREYVFKARMVQPMRGIARQLTPEYELVISKDSVIAFLPYFGRAYSAPIDPSSGGIKFTSTKFEYTFKSGRRGGWDIQIKPEDVRDVQQLSLSIMEDGNGSLQVTSTNRQPISFTGYIKERKQ